MNLPLIETILGDAATLVRARIQGPFTVTRKADASFLTDIDLAVQALVTERLHVARPDDVLLAEEEDAWQEVDAQRHTVWILDPIDGTQNLARSYSAPFAIGLAVVQDGRTRAAGCAFPLLDRMILADDTGPPLADGHPCAVSTCADAAAAKLCLEFHRARHRGTFLDGDAALLRRVFTIRALGSAIADLVEVATGNAEAFVSVNLSPWDHCAAAFLVERAGGRVTRFDGRPVDPLDRCDQRIVASNGLLHNTMLDLLAGHRHQQ